MTFDIWVQNVLEKKAGLADRGVATGVKKTRSDRPRCGHWSDFIPYGLWWENSLTIITGFPNIFLKLFVSFFIIPEQQQYLEERKEQEMDVTPTSKVTTQEGQGLREPKPVDNPDALGPCCDKDYVEKSPAPVATSEIGPCCLGLKEEESSPECSGKARDFFCIWWLGGGEFAMTISKILP